MSAQLPPNNQEAETSVLGAILLTGSADALAALTLDEGLAPTDFYRDRHRLIFAAMLRLADRREPIDAVTVCAELDQGGQLADAGGATYVHSVPNHVPSVGHVRRYARIVHEHAYLRDAVDAGRRITAAAFEGDLDAIAKAEGLLRAPESDRRRVTVEKRQEDLVEHVEHDVRTYPWPFSDLQELTGGIWPGQFTVLAGPTSHGKSVILDQVLENLVRRTVPRERVVAYLNEMTPLERDLRYVARKANIPLKRLMLGKLRDGEHQRFVNAIAELPFEIVPAGGMPAREIARDIHRRGLLVAGVDLLNGLPGSSRTEDIDENVRTLTSCAAETGCHIIACQHLNRGRFDGGYPPEPGLGDIRGSGQIADLANNVLFIYRKEALDDEQQPTGEPGDEAVLKAAKLRNGPPGRVPLTFIGGRTRFLPPAEPGTVGRQEAVA